MSKPLKKLLFYTVLITAASVAYFVYAWFSNPVAMERETFLSEIGEGVGTLSMWALGFIYLRTVLKIVMGRGAMSKRLLPEYTPPPSASMLKKFIVTLDRTHVHVGIASVAIILLHIALMGAPMTNLFFWAVLGLVVWQAVFGMFLRWRTAPRDIKKMSYAVHAQLITGVMLGIFAFFGHMLIDQ